MKLTDRTRIALIAAAIAVQLFVTLSLLFYTGRVRSHALKSGSIVSLACKAYDPFSPFKGRYVRLTFEQADIAREQLDDESREHLAETRGKKVYCRMQEGVDGIWTVSGIRRTHPQDGNVYIEVKNRWYSDTKVSLGYAFSEYYMQENYARLVDRIQWNDFNALEPVLSLYVGKDGRCVQKGLSVLDEGERIPIEEYCRRRLR
ncbi:MAG: GDYXXLXY domain-containing protein [Treponema sp.]|nr:GDYXXLXY domain-containing protein [Treponema sp.]